MVVYDKKILYLDYLENGEKIKNAGSAKILQQGTQCRISVNVNGLHKTDTIKCELCILKEEGEVTLDSIFLQQGRCVYSCLFPDIHIEDAYGIRIKISEQRCLRALWREPEPQPKMELLPELQPVQIPESAEEEAVVIQEEPESPAEPELVQESAPDEKQIALSQGRISDDKWEQLEQVFPMVHPFGNEKEYLSLTPRDFIVLNREYQNLANNSFLLHGFYNYHHIILGKMSNGEMQEAFYLGVPGVFYEREKAVALMFGFESFECAKEPAETGTFGYYMKRVEI